MAAIAPASAQQDYPNRPVKWIVGYVAGGSTDILARIFAQWFSERLGQQFIVENRPGAGNNLGTEAVINSPPDGYTLLLVNPANGINASLYKNLNFNFIRDIAPVAGFMRVPNVMEVNPDVPAKTVAEFIAYAKANPGKVNWASSGNGTSVHLSGEMFKLMTGVNLQHVPYRGSAPALTDMIGGQVQVMFDNMPSSIEHIRAGKLRALGRDDGDAVRSAAGRSGVGRLRCRAMRRAPGSALGVPKGTPRAVIDKLNREVNLALADPKIKAKLAELGGTLTPGTPEDFGKTIAEETEKWAKVVNAAGVKVE